MKTTVKIFLSIAFTLIILSTSIAKNKGTQEVGIAVLAEQLTKAVEVRNFQSAREIMDKMFPLMKKELKEDKKRLAELLKKENPEVSHREFKYQYDRKKEVLEFVKEVVESSPAALRVKSKIILSEIGTFAKLSNSNS
jgi:nucleoid DNA-binding protein